MASGKSLNRSNETLDYWLGGSTPTRPTSRKITLLAVAPTNSTPGTEISGTGYSAGGLAIVFGAASAGSASGPSSGTLQWTNGSGSSWSIVGIVVHSAASGAPSANDVIYWLDGLSVTVPDGNVLEIPTDGVSWDES